MGHLAGSWSGHQTPSKRCLGLFALLPALLMEVFVIGAEAALEFVRLEYLRAIRMNTRGLKLYPPALIVSFV